MCLNKTGFTLIEMLMVLFTISIIISITTSIKYIEVDNSQYQINLFMNNYSTLQLQSQIYANCKLKIYPNSYSYGCEDKYNKVELTDGVTITSNYDDNEITFNTNGNISRAGSLFFYKDNTLISKYTISIMTGELIEK